MIVRTFAGNAWLERRKVSSHIAISAAALEAATFQDELATNYTNCTNFSFLIRAIREIRG